MTVDNLFVCLFVCRYMCVYMLASSVYTIDLTDDIVDTSEERLLFFDVQKTERTDTSTQFVCVCIHHSAVRKTTKLSIIFILRIQIKEK